MSTKLVKFSNISLRFNPQDIKTCVYCKEPLIEEGRRHHREFCNDKCRFNFNSQAGQILRPIIKQDIITSGKSFIEWASDVSKRGSVTLDFQ